jgi:hypothetical protein
VILWSFFAQAENTASTISATIKTPIIFVFCVIYFLHKKRFFSFYDGFWGLSTAKKPRRGAPFCPFRPFQSLETGDFKVLKPVISKS